MTVDPHQARNIVESTDLGLVNNLSHLLAGLGERKGSSCYRLDPDSFGEEHVSAGRKLTNREDIKDAIRDRLPCHNPPNMIAIDLALGRKFFAANLPEPELFHFGFPYSDGDEVPQDMLDLWEEHEHSFY